MIDYIAKDNPAAALRLSDGLLDTAVSLGKAPLVGCRIKGFPSNVRMTVAGRYSIIYKLDQAQKQLLVLRFWHSARDPGKLQING